MQKKEFFWQKFRFVSDLSGSGSGVLSQANATVKSSHKTINCLVAGAKVNDKFDDEECVCSRPL